MKKFYISGLAKEEEYEEYFEHIIEAETLEEAKQKFARQWDEVEFDNVYETTEDARV